MIRHHEHTCSKGIAKHICYCIFQIFMTINHINLNTHILKSFNFSTDKSHPHAAPSFILLSKPAAFLKSAIQYKMKVIAHQTKRKYADIIFQYTEGDIIHSSNEILPTLENVVFLQSMTAHMIITFCHTPDTVYA